MSPSTRILLALIAGIVAGILIAGFAPQAVDPVTSVAGPIGQAWLNGLQMTIVPLVFSLLVTGVAATAEAAQAGKLAGRAVGLYLIVMAASAIAAAFLTPLFLDLVPLPADSAAALRHALAGAETVPPVPPVGDFLAGIIPANALKASADSNFLSMIVFALVFAFALMRIDAGLRDLITRLFAGLRDAMLVVIGWVLWIGPVGVFALALVVGAKAGGGAFHALVHYILTVSAVGLVVSLFAYPLAVIGGRVGLGQYIRAGLSTQAVAISTQSSLASLPAMLASSRAMGVPVATAGVTLPLAVAILRATGPAMNFAVAIYVATWFGVPLSPATLAAGALVAMLTSLGSVSLPGTVSFIGAISPVCATLGAPVAPLGLLVAVETMPDIVRTLGNVMWDLATTVTLARGQRVVEDEADTIVEGIEA
ncbi:MULTISPECIES: cation:dicarboxylase symporter family transporter [unclassified Sphingomonas]|uniref:dicarboxylate/amino acid:cation symporter n=1 Tax=unclassified Sphingomonas TaxID=196159 RepID=UPI00092953DF|nr:MULTISPECIES: cation:dicarboxylase symporter family transporter [unclassified Sphingomonas]MBN8849410.1 cation:dicarboxylase symporter family transporter [Sphingomonas sp.]OJV28857.1 MAG: sodium:dicarboxylate symporter [Sphingomonas sp. 67-36]